MGRNNYFSALEAKRAADKAVLDAICSQKNRVFNMIKYAGGMDNIQ